MKPQHQGTYDCSSTVGMYVPARSTICSAELVVCDVLPGLLRCRCMVSTRCDLLEPCWFFLVAAVALVAITGARMAASWPPAGHPQSCLSGWQGWAICSDAWRDFDAHVTSLCQANDISCA